MPRLSGSPATVLASLLLLLLLTGCDSSDPSILTEEDVSVSVNFERGDLGAAFTVFNRSEYHFADVRAVMVFKELEGDDIYEKDLEIGSIEPGIGRGVAFNTLDPPGGGAPEPVQPPLCYDYTVRVRLEEGGWPFEFTGGICEE